MSEPVKTRMARSCRWHGGITLRQYDEVERYDSRTCIGRFPDATVSQFLNAASAHTAKYGADPKRRAVIVIHCGRLHLVEEEDLTTEEPPAPPEITAPAKPAKQKALF
jgi:hypothetical protein